MTPLNLNKKSKNKKGNFPHNLTNSSNYQILKFTNVLIKSLTINKHLK